MAWTGDPIWLADVLRAEGLKVIEHAGWRGRGHGDFRDLRGVMCHHTAGGGPDDWRVVQNGRPGLPGPLAQLVLERDGTFRVIAVGVAWHAGAGSHPGWPTDNANWHVIGIEGVNNGVGQVWPAAQMDAYRRGCAAILRRIGRPASDCVGHKEWSSEGKIDPNFDMVSFRAEVARLIAGGPPVPVENEIDAEAVVARAWIGARLTHGELSTADGIGRFARFANGSIYWHPDVRNGEATAVPAHLMETYAQYGYETGFLGYPTLRHTVVPGVGDIQAFEGGTLYRRYGHDGFPVRGVIGRRWAAEGHETGPLGWPISDEYNNGTGGLAQDFQKGRLQWDPSGVVKEMGRRSDAV